ncbi:MAG: TetR/AcrR family transcriptional regulator, partial [Flavobacteriales bacterium]|nr:TetR/AcrR family transcriptional regulator [Flavobacteriales bacterium]
ETQIIEGASAIFMKYGIKSVNMDDVAKNLRISKKTLYKYVSDKSDLLRKALNVHGQLEDSTIRSICNKNLNAIDELFEISHFIGNMLKEIHPSIHFDLEKYHPELWNELLDSRHKMVYECTYANLKKGIAEGLYRKDLNAEVIARIYMAKMDVVFDGELFPPNEFNFQQVYLDYFRYHIRGLASDEGIKYLVQKMKDEKLKIVES